ncbi:MAG: cytochrome c oxidase subunit II transmembrane domain-containing protein [Steroidobacteraceae bacterium]
MGELIDCHRSLVTVLSVGTLIALAVCALMLYSIGSFRQATHGNVASFEHRAGIEMIWALIPILILITSALPAIHAAMNTQNSCFAAATSANQ